MTLLPKRPPTRRFAIRLTVNSSLLLYVVATGMLSLLPVWEPVIPDLTEALPVFSFAEFILAALALFAAGGLVAGLFRTDTLTTGQRAAYLLTAISGFGTFVGFMSIVPYIEIGVLGVAITSLYLWSGIVGATFAYWLGDLPIRWWPDDE